MRTARLRVSSLAAAETLLARTWVALEEHDIASPRMAIRVRSRNRLDLDLSFAHSADCQMVIEAINTTAQRGSGRYVRVSSAPRG